ncbi:MAG: Glu/Leu/Phe/Val dehydrogenase dimerization domain-containing protein [Gemmobacter sp.]
MNARADDLAMAFMEPVRAAHPGAADYLQAVEAIARDVLTVEKANADFAAARVLARLAEPDRVIGFRVVWRDDRGEVRINRGWRVQQSDLMGPYKGGLRWHPGVSLGDLRMLAFEQTFKNALTGLPMGGAKGGADFDARGASEAEVERFALAFMLELHRHIGPHRDVPAGDQGVGPHEIGLLAAAWRRLGEGGAGAITGKPLCLGGSAMRAEATGHGLVHFLGCMLAAADEELDGRSVAISGRGTVAIHAARKATEFGARVVSLSDSGGTFEAADGLTAEALDWLEAGARRRDRNPPAGLGLRYRAGVQPWGLGAEIALPCATQNEIGPAEARALVEGGCRWLAEGANLPVTAEARAILDRGGVVQAPGKAANAGGVAVSGVEMRQNATFRPLPPEEVEAELQRTMARIHRMILDEAEAGLARDSSGRIDYRRGANLAAYRRLARAMVDQGAL